MNRNVQDMQVKQIDPELTHSLRHRVLWPHIAREADCVIDIDNREDAIHLGTFDGERLVAIGSFFQMNSPKLPMAGCYRLRAMATDPEYRGTGAGSLLVQQGIELLASQKVTALWCDARLNAVGFYEKLGFSRLEEIYEVRNIGPHKFMWYVLNPESV